MGFDIFCLFFIIFSKNNENNKDIIDNGNHNIVTNILLESVYTSFLFFFIFPFLNLYILQNSKQSQIRITCTIEKAKTINSLVYQLYQIK